MSAENVEKQLKERRRRENEQRADDKEQRKLEKAFNQDGDLSADWLRELLETKDLQANLDEYEIRKIRGMINKQWMLGNLSEAQVHDRWYKLEVMKLKILGSFPPEESVVQGPIRAALYDDEYEMLESLTPEQRNAIDQIIATLQNMVTRSKGGKERELIDTSIAKTETEPREDNDGGKRFGLF